MRLTAKIFATLLLAVSAPAALTAQRVLMVGDSHVAGKIYPNTVEALLSDSLPDMDFDFFGVNGAAFATYNKKYMDTIVSYAPDVMIVHLGTNDSYARTFDADAFRRNMTLFYTSVRERLPQSRVVFVSPFYNKRKNYTSAPVRRRKGKKRRRRSYTWVLNENTRACADVIAAFCSEHDHAFAVDNNASHGMEFIDRGLIRNDFVHLSASGYEELGRQVAEELMAIPGLMELPVAAPADPTEADEALTSAVPSDN